MKAILINNPSEISVIELEKPTPGPGEVLLKVKYVGFCGSDLTTYLGKNPMVDYPRIPGHEISAEVVALGEGVPDSLQLGNIVTVIPYTHCGECPSCKRHRFNACQFNQTLGVQRHGAMAEYICIPWPKVLVVDGLDEIELAVIEPLTVGFHAVDRGRVTGADTVMVMGCGMIGIGAIVAAKERGAKVLAVDLDEKKLAVANQLGADAVINAASVDLSAALAAIAPGGVDVVIEAVGSPQTYVAAVKEVAFTGRVVCIGYAKDDVSFATKLFVQKELDILGARNATPNDFHNVIEFLRKKLLPLEQIITRTITLEQVADAVEGWAAEPGATIKMLLKL